MTIIIEMKKIEILSLLRENFFIIDKKLINDVIKKISNVSGLDLKENKDLKRQVIIKARMVQIKWKKSQSGRIQKDFFEKSLNEHFKFRIIDTFISSSEKMQLNIDIKNLHEKMENLRLSTLEEIFNFKKKTFNEKNNDNFSNLIDSIVLKVKTLKIDFDLVKNFEKISIN